MKNKVLDEQIEYYRARAAEYDESIASFSDVFAPAKAMLKELGQFDQILELACEAFFDPFVCYLDDEIVGSELRERIVGLTATWILLYIVYVMRDDRIRIVSARLATKAEREIYENQ